MTVLTIFGQFFYVEARDKELMIGNIFVADSRRWNRLGVIIKSELLLGIL